MTLQAITANRLSDGLVVYFTRLGGWSERLSDARATRDEAEAARLLEESEKTALLDVVGPYVIELERQDGIARPVRYRESIRAAGPSVETATAQTSASAQNTGGAV